jgi:hypothetical protein
MDNELERLREQNKRMHDALREIARLSNEHNPERNAYAAKLEEIARAGLPSTS